jgi:hypothetical protein
MLGHERVQPGDALQAFRQPRPGQPPAARILELHIGTRFGFFPELRTPQLPATHVRAGTGLEHWPGATSPTSSSALQSTSSLAPCDLVSHIFSPVIASKQPQHVSRSQRQLPAAIQEDYQRPNEAVLTPPREAGHDIPSAINSPGYQQGHGLSPGLTVQIEGVLTCQRLPGSRLPHGRPDRSH